jgi:integrase/recombinase XerD
MKRRRTTLHPSEWPALDQKLWQAANSPGGFLEPDGKAAHWRDKTRKGVVKRYGLWLGYLNETGRLDAYAPPADRIGEDTLSGYVEWLESRGNASTTIASAVRDLVEALRVMEPKADIGLLRELNITLHARQEPTRRKHTRIMHPDEILSGILTYLDKLPHMALPAKSSHAGKYRDGLAIAFLACRPIRLENLTETSLGQQLIQEGDRWRCQYGADEMKDNLPLDFTLPGRLFPYLEAYLSIYRPLLIGGNAVPHLWISTRGTPMSEQAIYWNTCRLTEELFGRPINPHLFRDCAASALATDDPEHILAIARILGHSSIETTTRHYNQSQMTAAGEMFHDVLADLRRIPATDQHWSDK